MAILLALAVTLAASVGYHIAVGEAIPGLGVLATYFLAYAGIVRLRSRRQPAVYRDEKAPDFSHWPTSGPIGRWGQAGLAIPWFATNLLSVLNPRQAIEVVRQIAGNAELESRERRTGDDGTGYRASGRYALPFRGEWLVYNGGYTPKTSHSWHVLGQRFALDFVQADEHFRRHAGRGTRAADYRCHDAPILAAAPGTVVRVENRVRPAPLLGWGFCDFTARSFVGNHVVVEHAPGEFGLYAHLVTGSVAVRPGERVARGQLLGRCGHTGHATEPHLHFHLQDSPDPFAGMGLPIPFDALLVNGVPATQARLKAGDRVRPRDEA